MRPELQLINHMLNHVGSLGWGEAALWRGAQDMGLDPDKAWLMVGPSVAHMIELFCQLIIYDIQNTLQSPSNLKSMPIKERMETLIMFHFQQGAFHKQALLKTVGILVNPLYAPLAFSFIYKILDAIWRQAGDSATDFSYYTKRFILGQIYLVTLLYWLNDRSENFQKTRSFLEKQLDLVLKIPSLKRTIKGMVTKLSSPFLRF